MKEKPDDLKRVESLITSDFFSLSVDVASLLPVGLDNDISRAISVIGFEASILNTTATMNSLFARQTLRAAQPIKSVSALRPD